MHRTGVWAICGVALLIVVDALGSVVMSVQDEVALPGKVLALIGVVAIAAGAVWLYSQIVMKRWAERWPSEVLRPGAAGAVIQGLAIGAGFIAISFGIVVALGADRVTGLAKFSIADLVSVVTLMVISAVLEELIFRGVLLQALERWLGWIPALALTSALFGAAHLANPGATWFSALAIAIEAGFMLGACFVWKRNLWVAIGVHAGWNGLESLLGIPVSGQTSHGVLVVVAQGSEWLSGGSFGIEASIVPMVLGAALGVWFLATRRRADEAVG